MNCQLPLPIFPDAPPLGRPDPDAQAVKARAGVEYYDLLVRNVLNRSRTRSLPFDWTINPYRGCELGCTYCYARYTHGFFDMDRWQDFEKRIFVKRRAAERLHEKVRKMALQGQPIAIGTATDPYQPAERYYGVTRSILDVFRELAGLDLSITTKSPLILRDLDLLAELDRKHAITVNMTLTTVNAALARRIEIKAPDPAARLRTIRKLTEEGIATRVFVMPVMPGINHETDTLRPLLEAARDAGAEDVVANPLFLRPVARTRFLSWLDEEFPYLTPLYHRLYGRRDHLSAAESESLLSTFQQLRLETGFPSPSCGRG